MTFVKKAETGTVSVNSHGTLDPNAPFGGFKHSGAGREHGRDGLDACQRTKQAP